RNRGGRQGRMGPNGYRKALRALDLGARLGLPLVSVIDTPGADPGSESEGGGLAGAIGSCLAAVLVYPHPTLAIVAGEGGSGGALCLAACDRVIAWENAVFSVTSPEGAAAILFRDASRAPEVAGPLRIGAPDLLELGAFDRLVAEPNGDAATAPDQAIARIAAVAAEELELLTAEATEARLTRRRERYRHPRSERLEEN
ncbi:MAG: carboxyl transferase domain-containing protein, partial [Actinomycetota bacterium]